MFHAVLLLFLWMSGAASAGEWLGGVGIFTNDFLGDGHDRWRTFSLTRSEMMETRHGPVEFRLRGEMIAPRHIGLPPLEGERPYVGLVAPGAFLHGADAAARWRIGGELVIAGPQSGMSELMRIAHESVRFIVPVATSGEVPDQILPTVSGEREWLAGRGHLRPFLAAEAGAETFLRAGFDLLLADDPRGTLFLREPVTGQRIAVLRDHVPTRPTFSLGADATRILDSAWLEPAIRKNLRLRLRAGIDAHYGGVDAFFGLTWLGPEYTAQYEGQIVGSVGAFLRF